jgi:glycosyltransferase involved in cell wall biosynthesis
MEYMEWIRRYDTLTDEGRRTIRDRIKELPYQPLISVVMPTYNTKREWLEQAIQSVQRQLYTNWELCIADDASSAAHVRALLQRYAADDDRIKLVFRHDHGHISAATNSALALGSGEFLTFLDHDDVLAEHALFWVVEALARRPDAQLVYSDEDKIDTEGTRADPYFKCDWNEDLFYSHNMICHLAVYRSDLVRAAGGLRLGFEGAQDYDLALRCIERIDAKQILHIPRILYHWRMHAGSTASGGVDKPYALGAGEKALNEHLQRRGSGAVAQRLTDLRMYRVRYQLPKSPPLVSLVIPTRNGSRLLRTCVGSILTRTAYSNYEIVIVDNGSDDPKTLDYLESLQGDSRISVIRDSRPFNYSQLVNSAVSRVSGDLVGLVNNDIEVISPEWLTEMVSHAVRPEVGAVGARLLFPNDTLQHGGVILGIRGIAGHAHKLLPRYSYGYFNRAVLIHAVSAVTGACLVIKKEAYFKVGGLNEVLKTAYNDIDFCLKLREAGYRNIYTPHAELYHHESATRGYDDTPEKQFAFALEGEYMKKRWGHVLLNDPSYNPNLTLEWEDLTLAWPPRLGLDLQAV